MQDPYYDQGSLYSLPYTIYHTGMAWRTDIVPVEPEELAAGSNPYEIFWNADYAGKVGIYDVYREALLARDVSRPPRRDRPEHRPTRR